MSNDKRKSRSRWDKGPGDYVPQIMKKHERTSGGNNLKEDTQAHENADEHEHEHRGRHKYDDSAHRQYHGKENGKDTGNQKRAIGYMRAWDEDGTPKGDLYHHKGREDGYKDSDRRRHDEVQWKEYKEDNAESLKHRRDSRSKYDGARQNEIPTGASRFNQRANEIDEERKSDRRSRYVSGLGEDERVHKSHDRYGNRKYGHDAEHRHYGGEYYDSFGRHARDNTERAGAQDAVDVERGRKRTRSRTPTSRLSSRDKSSSSDSESSSRRSRSSSDESQSRSGSRSKRVSGRSSHSSSKRKHRHRSRSHSRSGSRSSSEERERKRKKKDKKKDKSKKKDKDERRSILTGKKIKLKVKRDKGDHERDANRQELLQFLNSAYE